MRLRLVFINLSLVMGIAAVVLFVGLAGNYVSADNPTSFDWRDKDGQNWMTLVKDQGDCGSCWAFSAIGTVEAIYNIHEGGPNPTFDLSEEELVSDCLWYSNCCGGSRTAALKYIRDNGVVDEACFPYTDGTCECLSGSCTCLYSGSNECSDNKCSDKCSSPSEHIFIKATGYITEDPALIKEFLISRGPLAASMRMVWPDCGFDGNSIYRCNPDSPPNHAIVIVGYNDNEFGGYWIVKNSWGSDWGPDSNGYFRVGYGEAYIENGTYFANTNIDCGAVLSEEGATIVLTDDITNCPGADFGITIKADNITLDCDNHLIDGLNTDVTTAGIYLFNQEVPEIVTGVTVKNCHIEEFNTGIYMYGGQYNELINNDLENNDVGIRFHTDFPVLHPNSYNTITENSFIDNISNGIVLDWDCQYNTIWDNIFINNGSGGFYDGNAYEEATATNNNWDYLVGDESIGNYWDDFVSNLGFPNTYIINGPGDGIDRDPAGGAGYLCSSDIDCASGLFCAGSENKSARCGENPTPDSWKGGGDIPGCNDDPVSEYKDYYFDKNGNEGYEITDVKDCDATDEDDCGPNCPELSERTDWFVIEDTNTCDFVTFDADNNESNCTDCMGNNWWNLGGDIGQCCSDDSDEYITTRVCDANACISNPSDDACCNTNNKCVYQDQCYLDGYIGDIDGDSKNEKCDLGTWVTAEQPIDPLAPILLVPNNGIDFILGHDITFKWAKASGTNPQGYWFRVYENGEIFDEYEADPTYGFYFGLATDYWLKSNITEIVANDGTWEWEVGAYFGINKYQDIHWSEMRTLYKNTASVLLTPNDNAEVSVNEFFDWETVPGATNYIAKIT